MWIEINGIGVAAAFLAGTMSFLSPCVLPLVPAYVSYVTGRSLAGAGADRPPTFGSLGLSLCFVLGFSTVFVALGAGANALSSFLLAYRHQASLAGGAVVIVFGLITAGLLRLPWLERDLRIDVVPRGAGPAAAYLLGAAFGFGWTPCIGPVLGAILTVTAAAPSASGVMLLAVYSLGLGTPFVVATLFLGGFVSRLGAMRRIGRPLRAAAGAVMVLMGMAMVADRLGDLAFWFLATFPALSRLG
jgi:cytochrome c-type biogenesis protein